MDVVLIEGIAAIDDDIVRLQKGAETLDGFLGDLTGRQHHPNGTRLFDERLHHFGERSGSYGALLRQRLTRLGVSVEHHAMMSCLHQAATDVAAHATESD